MHKTILVNGCELAYLEQGSGPALLLVHGSFCDYRYWSPQMGPLADRHRVIAVSLRHHWPERWNGEGGGFSVRQHADDIAAFIGKLECGPVHLLGHSRGGNVAFEVATRFPDRVASLILADPHGRFEDTSVQHGDERRLRAVELIRQGDIEAGVELFIDAVSGTGIWKRLNARRRQMPLDNAYTLIGQVADMPAPLTKAAAEAIRVPVLFVEGEKSPAQYRRVIDGLAEFIPRGRRAVVPGASHAMSAENPRDFNAVVLDFLSKE
jgi:pimeloyl-ACP methyl ester carboxylesterase